MGKAKNPSIFEKLKNFALSPTGIQYIKYCVVGGIGVGLNMLITFVLAEFFFGRENYLYAFTLGTIFNLIYGYLASVRYVFPISGLKNHKKVLFFAYSIATVFAQIALADLLVSYLGIDYYMPALAAVIFVISVLSYVVFKYYIFSHNSLRQLRNIRKTGKSPN